MSLSVGLQTEQDGANLAATGRTETLKNPLAEHIEIEQTAKKLASKPAKTTRTWQRLTERKTLKNPLAEHIEIEQSANKLASKPAKTT